MTVAEKKKIASLEKEKVSKKEDPRSGLWREPITLESSVEEDPLDTLYQRREVGDVDETAKKNITAERVKIPKKSLGKISEPKTPRPAGKISESEDIRAGSAKKIKDKGVKKVAKPKKLSWQELKEILKINSDDFQFSDISEILRGRSLDIYVYLRKLAGDSGFCKLKHSDLSQTLNISRPTLFKQEKWLATLCLIKKHSLPGDPLGTTFQVFPIEEAMPVRKELVDQVESMIKDYSD